MNLTVRTSSKLHGSVRVPTNKSHSFRALLLAALAEGETRIVEPALSGDWTRGVAAMQRFGATITQGDANVWAIRGAAGRVRTPDDVIDCGNSGILLRFLTAMAALADGYTVITGDESLRHIRPCQPLLNSLERLGAWAVSTKGDGHAPVVVRGPMRGGRTEIDGADSQPISAMLIAAAVAQADTELVVHNPGEKPWVELTLDWLTRFGAKIENDNFERYRIPGRQKLNGLGEVRVPRDWSAAMYPIVAGVLCAGSEVRVPGLDLRDSQGDKKMLDVLRAMGADICVDGDAIIARSSKLIGRTIDCNDFIDQFMLLAVVGACAEGQTVLTNAAVCRHKECDRIEQMHRALKAMGADVEQRPDGLVVRKSRLIGAKLDSQADHRMVMTLAVAAAQAQGETTISDIECIAKTFPDFVAQMRSVGMNLSTAG